MIPTNPTQEPESPRSLARSRVSTGHVDGNFGVVRPFEDSQEDVGGLGGESPSNRRDLPLPNGVGNNDHVGVDRLSVSFQVGDYDPNPDHWDSHSVRHRQKPSNPWMSYEQLHPLDGHFVGSLTENYSRQIELTDGVEIYVGVQAFAIDGEMKRLYGKIEFNPSRIVDPFGNRLATVSESVASLIASVAKIEDLVRPIYPDDLSSFKIKRIDVAKDFSGVTSVSGLLRGLSVFPRKWARKNVLHNDPLKGGAQTLTVGSSRGLVKLYDKFVESKGAVPEGTLRWEVQARQAWSEKFGRLSSAADMTESRVVSLAHDRWSWSAMGTEVVLDVGVLDIAERLGVSERVAATFVGWLRDQGAASSWKPSYSTASKFRSFQRLLGVALGPEALSNLASSVRLDWESGTGVVIDEGS